MATATIGHNLPPDPFVLYSESIEDLLLEANNHLDGGEIETDEQEAAVASILTRLRREANAADDQRKAEKKPHDDAGKAVQAKWAPLLSKADIAITTAKNALAVRLEAKAAAQRAAADAAAQEAREKAALAARTADEANPASLYDQTTVRMRHEAAAEAQQQADRLAKVRPQAKGGERAVGLKSVWTPALTDPCAALRHYRETQPAALKEWLLDQAQRDVRAGKRSIPGFEITESKVAV